MKKQMTKKQQADLKKLLSAIRLLVHYSYRQWEGLDVSVKKTGIVTNKPTEEPGFKNVGPAPRDKSGIQAWTETHVAAFSGGNFHENICVFRRRADGEIDRDKKTHRLAAGGEYSHYIVETE